MPKAKKWDMPVWMRPFASAIVNTGDNDRDRVKVVERMYNGDADPRINLPLSTLQACVKSQVMLLYRLHDVGGLNEAAMHFTVAQSALEKIANSVDVVLGSSALPKKMRPGMAAVSEIARKAISGAGDEWDVPS